MIEKKPSGQFSYQGAEWGTLRMTPITLTRLKELSFADAVRLWNRGFEEYVVDVSMPMDRLIGRFGLEGLSPELSVVAWVDNQPVGFVMNGIRHIGGRKVAWNGGTGVIPEYRRHGIGRQLIAASLEVYREQGVEVATLEAIASNTKAIALYENMGYQTVSRTAILHLQTPYFPEAFRAPADFPYSIYRGIARDAAEAPFYNVHAPWQSQWQNVRDGESLVVRDERGDIVGYAIFKRVYDERNTLQSIVLLQCECAPGHRHGDGIVRKILVEVFGHSSVSCNRGTLNLDVRNRTLMTALQDAGFTVRIEQVYMERPMEEK